ncbi:MAG: hypothetical protein ACYS5V_14980, partial [Planctomycetota bacterium]
MALACSATLRISASDAPAQRPAPVPNCCVLISRSSSSGGPEEEAPQDVPHPGDRQQVDQRPLGAIQAQRIVDRQRGEDGGDHRHQRHTQPSPQQVRPQRP